MRRAHLIILFALFVSARLPGQNDDLYTRLTKPAVERALTLYKGQLQINLGYNHGLGTSKFSRNGTRLSFKETASNFLANDLSLKLAYGIIDFIEVSAAMDMINEVETLPTINYWNGEIFNEVNTNRLIQGLGNIDLKISLRQPFFQSIFDFKLWGGLSFPATTQFPSQPDHQITLIDPADPDGIYILNYNYRFRPGSNTTMFNFGLHTKAELNRLGLYLFGSYQQPFGPEQTYLWNHMLYGDQFTYRPSFYERLPGKSLQFYFSTQYQVFPWFAVDMTMIHASEFGGWTEETGYRVKLPDSLLGSVSAGFEIQVSPALRLTQHFHIPVYGKENYALYAINTGININLVPLKNLYY